MKVFKPRVLIFLQSNDPTSHQLVLDAMRPDEYEVAEIAESAHLDAFSIINAMRGADLIVASLDRIHQFNLLVKDRLPDTIILLPQTTTLAEFQPIWNGHTELVAVLAAEKATVSQLDRIIRDTLGARGWDHLKNPIPNPN